MFGFRYQDKCELILITMATRCCEPNLKDGRLASFYERLVCGHIPVKAILMQIVFPSRQIVIV